MVATHARYRMRKKPEVEVEAREWSWGAEEEPMLGVVPSRHARAGSRCGYCGHIMLDHGWLDTGGFGRPVCPGDWIVTSPDGTRYPCRPYVFLAMYEPIVIVPE